MSELENTEAAYARARHRAYEDALLAKREAYDRLIEETDRIRVDRAAEAAVAAEAEAEQADV